jgi:hypothetical protein
MSEIGYVAGRDYVGSGSMLLKKDFEGGLRVIFIQGEHRTRKTPRRAAIFRL